MPRRPGMASTRSKQHQAIRLIYSTDLNTAASYYNVSPKKLRQFVTGNPKYLKSRVQKDTAYSAIYGTDVKKLSQKNNVRLVGRLTGHQYYELTKNPDKVTPRQRLKMETHVATRVRSYRRVNGRATYKEYTGRSIQTQRARRELVTQGYSTFTTIADVQDAYSNGIITSGDVNNIVGIWKEHYNLTDARADELLEIIMNEGGPESGEE